MTRNALSQAALALCALVAATGAAAEVPDVIRITDGLNAGPAGQNDGPGAEQATVVHSLVDGKRYVTTVWMSSQLEGSAVPRGDGNNNNAPYQCKCSTYEIDPLLGPQQVVAPTFVTQNIGNRPCNHPHMAINPTTNQILMSFGTNDDGTPNGNGNVSPYVQAMTPMCQVLPVSLGADGPNTEFAQRTQRDIAQNRVRIDNRNQGANDGAPWAAVVNADTGLWQVGYLENNNKSRTVGVTLTAANEVTRHFDTIVINEAERGRPSVARISNDRTVVCSSDGLGRPPVNGVACAMFNAVTGQRLWRERIAQAQPNATPKIYFNQPIIVTGENGRLYVQVERTNGGGNRNGGQQGREQNRNRGASHNMIYTLLPDDDGAHIQTDATVDGIGVNQVHATACSGKYGPQGAWHVAVFDTSITGSGIASTALARFDIQSQSLVRLARNQVLGGYNADGGYLANLYGQNPNDQGRDYVRCIGDVPNPGFGVEGGYMPTVKSFFAMPYAGRVEGEPKNSLFLSLLPGEVPPPPVIPNHAVTVTVAGEGVGQVFSSPSGINECAENCTFEWVDATTVILTAIPAPGSTFAGWTSAPCNGTGACVFSLDGPVEITATFNAIPVDPNDQVGLIVNITGDGLGQVTSSPAGISCDTGTCAQNFTRNTEVTLTATPKAGSLFDGWSGIDGCTDPAAPCVVTMAAARTLTATFSVDPSAGDGDGGDGKGGPTATATGCGGCSGTGSAGDGALLAGAMMGLLAFRRRRRSGGARTFRTGVVAAAVVGVAGLTSCAKEPLQPVIDAFVPSEETVAQGTPVELQYTVRDAEGVTIGMVGSAEILPFNTAPTGSVFTPPLLQSSTFLLTAFNGELIATRTISVRVGGAAAEGEGEGEAPPAQAAVIAFAPALTTIEDGGTTTLSWTTAGARTGIILANDAVLQTIPAADLESGSATVTPTTSTVYTLTVAGINGLSTTRTTSVNVTPPGVTINAEAIFDANVKGILQSRCADCHETGGTPDLLGSGPDAYYNALIGNPTMVPAVPENSLLLVKGEHAGPAFTASEAQVVTQWLLAEAAERGLQGGNTGPAGTFAPKNLTDALTRFGACMERATWDATYGASNATQTARQGSEQGQCMACHTSGTGGAFLSASSGDTFEMHRLRPYVLKLVLSQSNEDGSFKDLVPAKRHEKRGGEGGDHPAYQLTPERIQALDSFVDQTLVRYHNYELDCVTGQIAGGGGGGGGTGTGGGTGGGGGGGGGGG
jgi:MYXO-CTERM domain-containing protein